MDGDVPRCVAPTCEVPVIWGLHNGVRKLYDAHPHPDGVWQLKNIHGSELVALRLTTAQQFGRQGRLHLLHACEASKRMKKR